MSLTAATLACAVERRTVYVVIPEGLAATLAPQLSRYVSDLRRENFDCVIRPGEWTDPTALRQVLREAWKHEGLSGALLIGAIPGLPFNHKEQRSDYWHDYPSDLYYMDLTGRWSDRDGDGVFDTWSSSRPEIWVSRIRTDTLPLLGEEAQILRNYFDRNHAYRTGSTSLPPERALVVYHNIAILESQAEHGGWGASPQLLYKDVSVKGPTVEQLSEKAGSAVTRRARADWIAGLEDPNGYELMVLNTPSFPDHHVFAGARDEQQPNRLDASEVLALSPKRATWFHLLSSETAYHEVRNYLAGIYLFSSPTAVAAFGGAQHSGAAGTRSLYASLSRGHTFGEAYFFDVVYRTRNRNSEFVEYVSWRRNRMDRWTWSAVTASVFLGDGTLRLPRFLTPS